MVRILLTSFTTWKNTQPLNSADELLLAIAASMAEKEQSSHPTLDLHFLRHLPVNVPIATELVLAQLHQLHPDLLLLCGMAETRSHLSLEAQATVGQTSLQTRLDLEAIAQNLPHTHISQNAGRFVCNGLYYTILLQTSQTLPCLFIHVPPLTNHRNQILSDFCQVIMRAAERVAI